MVLALFNKNPLTSKFHSGNFSKIAHVQKDLAAKKITKVALKKRPVKLETDHSITANYLNKLLHIQTIPMWKNNIELY